MTDADAYAKLAEDYIKLAGKYAELSDTYCTLSQKYRKLSNEYCSLVKRHSDRFVADDSVAPSGANAADNQPSGGEVSRNQANGQLQHDCEDGQGQDTLSYDADQLVKMEEAL